MNAKHKRFVAEYLIDLNATQAAIRAGYSQKTAYSIGHELLSKPEIRAAVEAANEKRNSKLEISAERVLQELAKLAFSNMADYMTPESELDLSKLTRDQAAAIQEITEDSTGGTGDGERKLVLRQRFKLADKGLNLERLGRHLKLFTDKVEVSGIESLADVIGRRRKAVGK